MRVDLSLSFCSTTSTAAALVHACCGEMDGNVKDEVELLSLSDDRNDQRLSDRSSTMDGSGDSRLAVDNIVPHSGPSDFLLL